MRVPKRGALFSVKLLIKLRWKKEEWYQHNYFGTLVPTYLRNYVLVNFFDLYSGVNLNLNCGKGKIIKYSCFLIFTNRGQIMAKFRLKNLPNPHEPGNLQCGY